MREETESERERLKFLNCVCTEFKQTEFNELGLYSCKPSSLNSFSSLTKRV